MRMGPSIKPLYNCARSASFNLGISAILVIFTSAVFVRPLVAGGPATQKVVDNATIQAAYARLNSGSHLADKPVKIELPPKIGYVEFDAKVSKDYQRLIESKSEVLHQLELSDHDYADALSDLTRLKKDLEDVREREHKPDELLTASTRFSDAKSVVDEIIADAEKRSPEFERARTRFEDDLNERTTLVALDKEEANRAALQHAIDLADRTVKTGMTVDDVKEIWGEPDSISDFGHGHVTRQWDKKSQHGTIVRIITVEFEDGAVTNVLDTKFNDNQR